MAELADAQASGACGSNIVRVQVPLPALFFCLCTGWLLFYIIFCYRKKVAAFTFFCKHSDLFFHLLL